MSLASGYPRAANDWYQESRECVELLLNKEQFNGVSWDPCCGDGNIPKTLNDRGMSCFGSDIEDRGYGNTGVDFFKTDSVQVDNIISNPPYNVTQEFVERALKMTTRKVAIIIPLSFLESQRREQFFSSTPFKKIYVSRKRLSMPPGGTGIKAKGGIKAYAWHVWEHGYSGPPTIDWI